MTTTPNNTSSKRRLLRTLGWVAVPAGVTAVFGAGCIDGPLGLLLQLGLLLLGVTPAANFQDNGQVEFSLLQTAEDGSPITPTDEKPSEEKPSEEVTDGEVTDGEEPAPVEDATSDSSDPAEYYVEVYEPAGTRATVKTVFVSDVEEVGTFSVIIDSSGSMERSYPADEDGFSVCPTCPHDPNRRRVDATQTLVKEVLNRTPESRMGIFDFGAGPSEQNGFKVTQVLQGYTSDVDALVQGADRTTSAEGTFIYDSAMEVIDLMTNDIQQHFQTKPITKAIIMISDGEDTESVATLEQVIAKAKEKEIPIHVIALGQASSKYQDSYQTDIDNKEIVTDFQRLAAETGGFYATITSNEDLVALAEVIALGLTGGYEKLVAELDPVPACGTVVKGTIYAGNPKENPDLQGEDWSFVAPCN